MKNIKFFLTSLFSLLFSQFKAAEEEVDEKDLAKSLSDSLSEMEDLLKSSEGESTEDLLKTKEGRDILKAKLKEADDDEDDEDDDEEAMKGSKYGKKMKKSMDDFTGEYGDVVDANEVLKSFVSVVEENAKATAALFKSVEAISTKMGESEKLMKSMALVTSNEAELIKSMNETFEKIGSKSTGIKGAITVTEDESLFKSLQTNDEEKKVTPADAFSIMNDDLQKAQEDGNFDLIKSCQGAITRYEMSGFNPSTLPKTVIKKLSEKQGDK